MLAQSFTEVSQAADLATFQKQLVRVADRLGFPLVSCVLRIDGPTNQEQPKVFAAGNTPEAFASWSDSELVDQDPVIQQLRRQQFSTISYDHETYVRAGAAHLWEEQAAFGYKQGVAVSLDLPNGHRFALGMDREEPLPDGADLTMLMANVQFLAVHAQAAADRLLPLGDSAAPRVPLTPREIEILKLAMDGKSSAVIAQLLNINVGTVNFHVQKVCNKLGVASRLQAALKAQALRLI